MSLRVTSRLVTELRSDLGVSQAVLGEILGVERFAVIRWERGEKMDDCRVALVQILRGAVAKRGKEEVVREMRVAIKSDGSLANVYRSAVLLEATTLAEL